MSLQTQPPTKEESWALQLEYSVNEPLPRVNFKLDTSKLEDDNLQSFGKVVDPALIAQVEDALWNAGYRGRNGWRLRHGKYLEGDFEVALRGAFSGPLVARMWERPVLIAKSKTKETKTNWWGRK
jgi:hypothetical protein